ncbi:MAG: hypothetical protein Q9M94_07475 [Candidatus Gracilibacteria bacterium]|nr:hypothetical protein [Candidatus Gracilibacteria bacterium]
MNFYQNIEEIFLYKNGILELHFNDFSEELDVFIFSEIISYALTKFGDKKIESIIINGKSNISEKRKLVKKVLLELFGIQKSTEDFSDYIKIFSNKNEFYASGEKILKKLGEIGLSDDTSYLIFSSLGEIIDNSFFHNLGRWTTPFGPKCFFYFYNNKKEKQLNFVISDLGIGFKGTLKNNFPELDTEKDALQIALKPGITGRYENKGGNGLVFLQKNIFNGFKGELFIRSNNFIAKVDSFAEISEIRNDVKILGTMVKFDLFY